MNKFLWISFISTRDKNRESRQIRGDSLLFFLAARRKAWLKWRGNMGFLSNKEKCMVEIGKALDNNAVCGIMKVSLFRYFYVWFRSMFYAKFKEV